jgi:hypothetical protein
VSACPPGSDVSKCLRSRRGSMLERHAATGNMNGIRFSHMSVFISNNGGGEILEALLHSSPKFGHAILCVMHKLVNNT